MKNPQDVIYQPLITEKSTILREQKDVYCFKVNPRANKIEIAKAIETLFQKVKVADVRTSRVLGKIKRMGRYEGRRPGWKKAWVRLAPGSKEIEFFETS
jgi:large subunit ribosomal protein L23